MNIDHVNRAYSAKSHKSDLLSKGILQTTASLHHTHDALSELTLPSLEAGLYFSLTLFNLLINSDVSFIKITKRLRENKKKYDELSVLVKPVDAAVERMTQAAIDHAGDPKFADPTTSSLGLTDDKLQKIIDLVKHLQPSSTLTLAQLKDVSTALKLSELRAIVNDGNRKMLALNALNQKDLTIINEQTNNMQVLSEFFSRVISSVNAMAGYFGARS